MSNLNGATFQKEDTELFQKYGNIQGALERIAVLEASNSLLNEHNQRLEKELSKLKSDAQWWKESRDDHRMGM